eukprot:Awhi_evm1s14960
MIEHYGEGYDATRMEYYVEFEWKNLVPNRTEITIRYGIYEDLGQWDHHNDAYNKWYDLCNENRPCGDEWTKVDMEGRPFHGTQFSGFQKFIIAQSHSGILIRNIKIVKHRNYIGKKIFAYSPNFKGHPLKWNDIVTINSEYHGLDQRPKSIGYVSNYTGVLKMSRKTSFPERTSFQILNPVTGVHSECIHWYDDIVLVLREANCEVANSCKVASMSNDGRFEFVHGNTSMTLKVLPTHGAFRNNSTCILANDKISLAHHSTFDQGNDCGINGCKVATVTNGTVAFSSSDSSAILSLKHVQRNRALNWRDHVVINTGFSTGGSLIGEDILYVENDNKGVLLQSAPKTSNPPRSVFRLLPSLVSNHTKTTECISWGDEIVIRLNNLAQEEGCLDSVYGCRILSTDPDNSSNLIFEPSVGNNAFTTVFLANNQQKTGCIRAGEQVQVQIAG